MRLFFMALIILLPSTVFAARGQEGGGGSELELDFVKVGRYAVIGISNSISNNENIFIDFDLDSFSKAVGAVQVHEVSSLCLSETGVNNSSSNRCLDAYYTPSKNLIQLNASTWSQKSCSEKMAIAVHEFGRASGNENSSYEFSSKVSLSASMAAQCIPYYNQAGSGILSCTQKASYLEQALLSLNLENVDIASGEYERRINQLMSSWKNGIGRECLAEGQSTCLKACFLQAGSKCFVTCSSGN